MYDIMTAARLTRKNTRMTVSLHLFRTKLTQLLQVGIRDDICDLIRYYESEYDIFSLFYFKVMWIFNRKVFIKIDSKYNMMY